ncbi:MAG: hypothetical protein ABEI52_07730 [Halobacteriaceae archaeon]
MSRDTYKVEHESNRKGAARMFSEPQIVDIRVRYCHDLDQVSEIADDYDVSGPTISAIVRGESYRDCGGPVTRLQEERQHVPEWDHCAFCQCKTAVNEALLLPKGYICPICRIDRDL